ncbi:MAG: hypothetical protein R3310_05925 [Candidatus Competibacteraceae bacterium]|nr:hypothetical protein [Candidatus Competibacteraceae bacterium]
MPDWFVDNLDLITTLTNVAMLLVWIFYARLLYKDFRRQRSPVIFIHRTFGEELNPHCLVVNLSADTVHILCVMLTLHTRHGQFTGRITDYKKMAPDHQQEQQALPVSHEELMESIKQGPLSPGYFLNLNTFRTMVETVKAEVVDGHFGEDGTTPSFDKLVQATDYLSIRVVAIYGRYEKPVAARRTFEIERSAGGLRVIPTMDLTKQYRSYWQRRTARRWLKECP